MFHPFGAHGVTLVGDDEAGGLAVRRHHQFHARLDVIVVETLVRDVEEVVAAGLVEVVADVDQVVEGLVGRQRLQIRRPVTVDQLPLQGFGVVSRGFQLRDDLWEGLVDLRKRDFGVLDVFGQLVDVVERVEYRSERPANRNVETVCVPIKVAFDRAEEIVEI